MKARLSVLVALAAAVTLTSVAAGGPTATKQRAKQHYPDVTLPAWSPDGQRIAFLAWRPTGRSVFEMRVVNADGSGQRGRVLVRKAGSFSWSPDGRRIAFEDPSTLEIYVVNADGSGQRTLPRSRAVDFIPQPAWSPDGQKILFVSDRDGLEAVYVMNADGSRQRRLTSPAPPAIPFRVRCRFSHRHKDDPIVSPGQPGSSHDHTFFGNRSTDAFSTPASLRSGGRTTCSDRADSSAYWAPTLYVAGRAVEPLALIATHTRRTVRPVDPFPAGLKVIAGDANARTAQSRRVTSWSCAGQRVERSSTIPRCPVTRHGGLRLEVSFPDCWDGRRLDSADHKSQMAYSSRGACPRSHPVAVPALSLAVHYPVSGRRDAELASGGQFSGHADFINAWNGAALASWVRRYLNRILE